MAQYRVYRISAAGRIVSGEWLTAATDAEAQVAAHALCDERHPNIELWRGAQRLALLACEEQAA